MIPLYLLILLLSILPFIVISHSSNGLRYLRTFEIVPLFDACKICKIILKIIEQGYCFTHEFFRAGVFWFDHCIYVNQRCMVHPDQLCTVRINFSLSIEIDVPDSLTAHSYIIDTASSHRIRGLFYLDLAPRPSLSNERF